MKSKQYELNETKEMEDVIKCNRDKKEIKAIEIKSRKWNMLKCNSGTMKSKQQKWGEIKEMKVIKA